MRSTYKVVIGVVVALAVVAVVTLVVTGTNRGKTEAVQPVHYTTSDVVGVYALNRPKLKESVRLRPNGTFVYHFLSTESGRSVFGTTGKFRVANGRVHLSEALENWQYVIGNHAATLTPATPSGPNVGRTLTRTN